MSDDLKRLQRLLKVQTQLHDLAERRLRQTDGAAAALAVERRRLVEALNDSATAHADLVLAITATRLRGLDRQIAAAEHARSDAAAAARLQAGRKSLLESRHAAAADAAADAAERGVLEEIGLTAALAGASPDILRPDVPTPDTPRSGTPTPAGPFGEGALSPPPDAAGRAGCEPASGKPRRLG